MRFASAIRAGFRTRRRTAVSLLLLAALALGSWRGIAVARGHFAERRASESLARYDFADARRRLESAGELRPSRPEVWLLAAQAARRDGDMVEAKSCLRRYKSLAGTTPEWRLENAMQDAQSGEIESHVYDLMAKIDADHPAREQILEALAVGCVHVYHFDRAGFWIGYLLRDYPKNPIGRLIRARMDDVLGKRDKAAEGCREILDDFPDNIDAKILLAGLLYRAQQFKEAAEQYEELRQKRAEHVGILLGLIRSRDRMGRPDLARPLVLEMESQFPNNSEARLECGRFALGEGRNEDAQRLLREAESLAPNDHEIQYQLGLCLERLGRPEEARSHFDRFKQVEAELVQLDVLLKAVVSNPRDPNPRREAGLICLRNQQPGEGLRWLHGALEVAPSDRLTHAALADYYAGQGNEQLANHHRLRSR